MASSVVAVRRELASHVSEFAQDNIAATLEGISDTAAIIADVQKGSGVLNPAFFASVQAELSSRIYDQSKDREALGNNMNSITSIILSSIDEAFNNAQATRNSMRAKFAAERTSFLNSGLALANAAIASEGSRATAEASIMIAGVSTVKSTYIAEISAAISAQDSAAFAECNAGIMASADLQTLDGSLDYAAWFDAKKNGAFRIKLNALVSFQLI